MSTDDFLKELRRDMGSELAPVYHALWHEVVWLHVKWKRYCQLYAPSSEHIPLLKRVASEFFGVLGFALWEDVVLHAARLTDPPDTGKGKGAYPNLTLQRLPALVDDAVRDELQELVVTAVEACKTLKARRDKWIAHRDLNLALDASPSILPGIDFGEIEHVLETMRRAMNHLEVKYSRLREGYEYASPIGGGDVDSLIYYLDRGVRAVDRQMECWRTGRPLPEDNEP